MTTTETAQSAGVWPTFRDSPLAVKTFLAGIFISRLGGFLNLFIVLYLASQGYSAAQASIALGVYGGGVVLGILIGGSLSDRIGARNTTVLSVASAGVVTAALLYLPNYPSLLCAIAVAGIGSQMFRPAASTLLSELTAEDDQVMIFAMYRFAMNLGAMAAPLIGFGLYNLGNHQYTLLFWAEALAALAYAVLAYFTLPPHTKRNVAVAADRRIPKSSYLEILRDRRFTLFLVITLVHSACYVQYLSTLPLDVVASGLPVLWYTLAVALNGFIVIAFELPTTKITQKWPFRLTISLAFATLAGGLAFYALPLGPAVVLIGTLIWSLGEIIGGPAIFAYPAVVSPPHLKSRYLAAFHFMFALGAAVGPVIGGWLFVEFGHSVWLILAVGSVLTTAAVQIAVRQPKKSSNGGGELGPTAQPADVAV